MKQTAKRLPPTKTKRSPKGCSVTIDDKNIAAAWFQAAAFFMVRRASLGLDFRVGAGH